MAKRENETPRVFPCRIEEIPTLAGFILSALNRDAADFAEYTDFNDPFPANFETALAAVNEVINPEELTKQMTKLKTGMYKNIDNLRDIMNTLENYVTNAKDGLTMTVKGFGIIKARKFISNKDAEGLDGALKTVEQNITANFAALSAKGYTAAKQTELTTLHAAIMRDNNAQNSLTEDREIAVAANIGNV